MQEDQRGVVRLRMDCHARKTLQHVPLPALSPFSSRYRCRALQLTDPSTADYDRRTPL